MVAHLQKRPRTTVRKSIIVKGDTVFLRRGREKGRTGVVKSVDLRLGTAIVEGLNLVKRHRKAGQPGQPSGILEQEAPIPLCALMLFDAKAQRPLRVRRVRRGNSIERLGIKTGSVIPFPERG